MLFKIPGHYQILALMNKILANLSTKPKKINVDTIYLALANVKYVDNLGIVRNPNIIAK